MAAVPAVISIVPITLPAARLFASFLVNSGIFLCNFSASNSMDFRIAGSAAAASAIPVVSCFIATVRPGTPPIMVFSRMLRAESPQFDKNG